MTICWIDRPTLYSQDRHLLGPARPGRPGRPWALTAAPCRADTLPSALSPSRSRLVRLARRLTVAVVGMLAVLAGVAMLVLPGPGLATIALGFGILGREYTWAARLSAAVRARIVTTTDAVRQAVRRP